MKINNTIKSLVITVLFLAVSVVAGAQTTRTGYFLKGNAYRYRLNPALMNDQHYFAFPLLGEIDVKTTGNLGLSNFIFDSPDGTSLLTFMHPSVSADDFLADIKDYNKLAVDLDVTLMSFGFFGLGGYNTFDVGLHSHTALYVPYDMFRFMKTLGGGTYSFDNMSLASRNYIDIALGHSHKFNNGLTVGARFKVLLGAAYANLLIENMDVAITGEQWMIDTKASLSAAFGAQFNYDENGMINSFKEVVPGLNGLGVGVDLGFTYDFSNTFAKGLIISASVTDLGYMTWKNVLKLGYAPEPYSFKGFENLGEGESIEEQLEAIGDGLAGMLGLADEGVVAEEKEELFSTLHIGLEYKMPFYDKLSLALLYSNSLDELYPFHQFSIMANLSPTNWFSIAVSGTKSTLGMDFGAMVNLHCTGFNIFVATDCMIYKYNKQYIPLDNLNANVSVGFNIPLGKKR